MAAPGTLALLVAGLLPTAFEASQVQNGEASAGGQWAATSLQPALDATHAPREEAIVVSVANPNEECFTTWLKALALTRGPERDVVVLYDEQPNNLLHDVLYERQIPCPDKFSWQTWGSVWGTSKGVKAGEYMWSAASGYERIWHLETDVVFTGRWQTFFDAVQSKSPDASLVGLRTQDVCGASGSLDWCENCTMAGGTACNPGLPASSLRPRSMMQLVRTSRRFNQELNASLWAREGPTGHHEALAFPFCNASAWCTMDDFWDLVGSDIYQRDPNLPDDFRERLHTFLEDSWLNGTAAGQIYHPAKCSTDPHVGALQYNWAMYPSRAEQTGEAAHAAGRE